MSAYLFLAKGFEEIEAVSTVDILRRADIDVKTISIETGLQVSGAHNITIKADLLFENIPESVPDMLILPGGMPGATGLSNHNGLNKLLLNQYKRCRPIAAICAAPFILGRLGILNGLKATCFPGFESELKGATLVDKGVVTDDFIITAKGPAFSTDFALAIIDMLKGKAAYNEVKSSLLL